MACIKHRILVLAIVQSVYCEKGINYVVTDMVVGIQIVKLVAQNAHQTMLGK